MTPPTPRSRVLRWYPRAWRDRYGDELLALLEDTDGDRPLTLSSHWSIARAGLTERGRSGGWFGDSVSSADRVRAGALIVVWAWTALVVTGAAFAKLSEHFAASLPPSGGAGATGAWSVVEVSAVIALVAVLLGGAVAMPAFLRTTQAEGFVDLRRPVVRVISVSSAAIVATAALVWWAQTQPTATREDGVGVYGIAFIAWAALLVVALVSWSSLAVAIARRIRFTRTELAAESLLAVVVALAVVTITVAMAMWWWVVATSAPWFLDGRPVGTPGSGLDLRLLCVAAVSAASAAAASYGVARIARSWPGIPVT